MRQTYLTDDELYPYRDNEDAEFQTWNELNERVQTDLTTWLNRPVTDKDHAPLAALYFQGEFRAWDCPMCRDRCYDAGEENEWANGQDSLNPNHSYFGNLDIYTEEFRDECCDTCRCYPQRFFPNVQPYSA